MMSSTHLNKHLWRWAIYLQDFCVLFKYRPGRENIVADGFSRQAWSSEEEVPQLESRLGESTFRGTQEDPQKMPRRGAGTFPGAEEDLREENPRRSVSTFPSISCFLPA